MFWECTSMYKYFAYFSHIFAYYRYLHILFFIGTYWHWMALKCTEAHIFLWFLQLFSWSLIRSDTTWYYLIPWRWIWTMPSVWHHRCMMMHYVIVGEDCLYPWLCHNCLLLLQQVCYDLLWFALQKYYNQWIPIVFPVNILCRSLQYFAGVHQKSMEAIRFMSNCCVFFKYLQIAQTWHNITIQY